MSRFFTSDMHFGHVRIIELAGRPFDSVEEMNNEMVSRWNQTVSPDDTVYIVGDGWMGQRRETVPLAKQLNGRLMLIPGNHDEVHPLNKRRTKMMPLHTESGITVLPTSVWLNIGGHNVELNHFPFQGDSHGEDRYTELRPRDEGQLLIHGHVHEMWLQRGRMLNVGVDVWDFTPVSEQQVKERFGI